MENIMACVIIVLKIIKKKITNLIKKKRLISNKEYRHNNKEQISIQRKEYRQNNKEKITIHKREYNQRTEVKNRKNERKRERRKYDIVFKLREQISNTICRQLKNHNTCKNGNSILDYLEYTIEELKLYLESLFEPWMNWDNWGIYNPDTYDTNPTWHLDHIIAQSLLPYENMTDENFKKCWALSNLRPLSSKQNVMEGNRFNRC